MCVSCGSLLQISVLTVLARAKVLMDGTSYKGKKPSFVGDQGCKGHDDLRDGLSSCRKNITSDDHP